MYRAAFRIFAPHASTGFPIFFRYIGTVQGIYNTCRMNGTSACMNGKKAVCNGIQRELMLPALPGSNPDSRGHSAVAIGRAF